MNAERPRKTTSGCTHHASVLLVAPNRRAAGREEDVAGTNPNDIRSGHDRAIGDESGEWTNSRMAWAGRRLSDTCPHRADGRTRERRAAAQPASTIAGACASPP